MCESNTLNNHDIHGNSEAIKFFVSLELFLDKIFKAFSNGEVDVICYYIEI